MQRDLFLGIETDYIQFIFIKQAYACIRIIDYMVKAQQYLGG